MLFLGKKPPFLWFTHGALCAEETEAEESVLIIIYNEDSANCLKDLWWLIMKGRHLIKLLKLKSILCRRTVNNHIKLLS